MRWDMPSMSHEDWIDWQRSLALDPGCSDVSRLPASACDADVEVRGIVQRYGWSPDGRREVQTYRPDELHAALQQTPEGLQVIGQGPTLTIYQLNRVKRRLWEDCEIDYQTLSAPLALNLPLVRIPSLSSDANVTDR